MSKAGKEENPWKSPDRPAGRLLVLAGIAVTTLSWTLLDPDALRPLPAVGLTLVGLGWIWTLASISRWRAAIALRLDRVRGRLAEHRGARRHAEDALSLQTRVLGELSHELRTPLNGVVGMAEVLSAEDTLPPDTREAVDTIMWSGEQLHRLADELCDLTRPVDAAPPLRREPFDVRALASEVARHVGPAGQARGLDVVCRLPEARVQRVVGDFRRLRQVLERMALIALEYTDTGPIDVSVDVFEDAADRVTVRGGVFTTRSHLAPERLRELLDGSGEPSTSLFDRHRGLPACRRLIELMGGRLDAESRPGEGSSLWFEVQLDKAPAPSRRGRMGTAEGSAAREVLVVDDNDLDRLTLGYLLAELGCVISFATHGREAVELCEDRSWPLIFMDRDMPRMDGRRATARIRELPGDGPRPTIIGLTAHAEEDDELWRESGLDGYLVKPVALDDIRDAVERVWPSRVAPRQVLDTF